MEIQCPTGDMDVLVSGTGNGTICVRGIVTVADGGAPALPTMVRVRILDGHVDPPYPLPDPKQPNDVDTRPNGQDWCAQNVPAFGTSSQGVPITVLAWERVGKDWGDVHSKQCKGGGSDPTDCCSGCS